MKTFDEACDIFRGFEHEKKAKEDAYMNRFGDLLTEVRDNPKTWQLCAGLVAGQGGSATLSMDQRIYVAFAMGIMVGIEMEKAE